MNIKSDYSLRNHNTLGIDVNADKFITINSEDDIYQLLESGVIKNKEFLILGGGSNILFRNDFNGVVIKSGVEGIKILNEEKKTIMLEVGSGVIWDDLVNYSTENGYGGIENLAYIPGTAGAAPIQNIGAYGVEFEEVFIELEGIDLRTGSKKIFNKSECQFGYRESVFKGELKNKFIITKIRIKLNLDPMINISYRAIDDYIGKNKIDKESLNIKEVRDIITAIRKSKLPDPLEIGNAGSFFKNPVIDSRVFAQLKNDHKDLVFFEIGDNKYKIPAAWLIEKIGFKGKRKGNVGVHNKQALVLVNYGNGTGEEIIKLADEIKNEILIKFNIALETEVNIVQ